MFSPVSVGDGWLEVDANDNPLRDLFCGPILNVREGTVELDQDPGLGIVPELSYIERYRSS
ncbi:L-alanine-DL-glutamate epimerase-like enolase superfamily enzyme [Bradyrhizobium sp. LM6.10]